MKLLQTPLQPRCCKEENIGKALCLKVLVNHFLYIYFLDNDQKFLDK